MSVRPPILSWKSDRCLDCYEYEQKSENKLRSSTRGMGKWAGLTQPFLGKGCPQDIFSNEKMD